MLRGGTVKQFKDALDEMKKIYPYDDEKTRLCTLDCTTQSHDRVEIYTVDDSTGIEITMSKFIKRDNNII